MASTTMLPMSASTATATASPATASTATTPMNKAGDFTGIYTGTMSLEMTSSAYKAITCVDGGWEFLSTYSPELGKGFMFSEPPPMMQRINSAISELYGGHSGSSYGWTMRVMEDIAKNGWDQFCKSAMARRVD